MKLDIYIADHFDTLASGKLLALGLFADRVLVLQVPADVPEPTAESPFGTDLGLAVTLSELPAGPLSGEISIVPPIGQSVSVAPFSGMTVVPGKSINIVTKLQPLLVPQAGQFRVEVEVNQAKFSATFEVRINRAAPIPEPLPSAAAQPVRKPAAPKQPAKKRSRAPNP